jgi:hypothetical protein
LRDAEPAGVATTGPRASAPGAPQIIFTGF